MVFSTNRNHFDRGVLISQWGRFVKYVLLLAKIALSIKLIILLKGNLQVEENIVGEQLTHVIRG